MNEINDFQKEEQDEDKNNNVDTDLQTVFNDTDGENNSEDFEYTEISLDFLQFTRRIKARYE